MAVLRHEVAVTRRQLVHPQNDAGDRALLASLICPIRVSGNESLVSTVVKMRFQRHLPR